MNLPAVNHRPTQEFIYPASRNELILQLFTAAKDIDEVLLSPRRVRRKQRTVCKRKKKEIKL